MYRYFADNVITGEPMYCSSDGLIHYKLEPCPHCGRFDVYSYDETTRICPDCFKTLRYFNHAKGRISEDCSLQKLHRYKHCVKHYLDREKAGITYMMPQGLEEQLERIQSLLARPRNTRPYYSGVRLQEERTCKDCGSKITIGVPFGSRVRCVDCANRYHRYQQLSRRVAALMPEEVQELSGLLDRYAEQMRRGAWAPDILSMRRKLNERMQVLRGQHSTY